VLIGVLDSGVGGVSVLNEIRALLPAVDVLFVADSAYAPYGPRTPEWIQQRSDELARFLVDHGAQAIVVACNTATAAAAQTMRAAYDVPIVAMEPAVKPAAAATRNGVVGVLATVGTLKSARFAALLDRFGADITVVTEPGVGLVEQVEAGELSGPRTTDLVKAAVTPLLDAGADVIVLGCTHYPFLKPVIQEVAGEDVVLIDTGGAVARRLADLLLAAGSEPANSATGTLRFWTSGDVAEATRVISALYGEPVEVEALPR
jgi:glutamate racemase